MRNLPINLRYSLVLIFIFLVGIFFRLYHIEFGLPHSFHADEPEIAELAIKYTYEIRDIVKNNNYYKLIPISYVYGTFPTYVFTLAVMGFSKTSNLLNVTFDKTTIYVFLRSLSAILSMLIIPVCSFLYYKIFKDKFGMFLTFLLLALNWKLIVHAHYINVDTVLTILLNVAFLTMYLYSKREKDTKYTILTGVFFGLAVGTKITTLITLPLFLYIFFRKKGYRELFAFLFIVFIAYAVSNPFSLIFANDFVFRIYRMKLKEGGLVFDSVDSNPFKYILGLGFISTPLVLLTALYGIYGKLACVRKRQLEPFDPIHTFLIGHVLIYLIFYSTSSRNVSRWLLPILPIVIIYSSYGLSQLRHLFKPKVFIIFLLFALGYYTYFPILLLTQFQRHTQKSAAYIWLKENTLSSSNKLAITQEGLDPLNKLEGILVKRYEVYESESAQFAVAPSPHGYDYVIVSSRPMENFKRPEIRKAYPFYYDSWQTFENILLDETKFILIKEFVLPKPNLINLSDVFIYKSTNYNSITSPL
jgi:hypothetical protein